MKRNIFLTTLIILTSHSFSQDLNQYNSSYLYFDIGSLRNKYLYPITNIKYSFSTLSPFEVDMSVRLRSYGTLFIYSNSAYDLSLLAEYQIPINVHNIHVSAGLGMESQIRLTKDLRSDVKSGITPILSLNFELKYNLVEMNVACWSRLYSNGIGLTLMPELSFSLSKQISMYMRYEVSNYLIYNSMTNEWQKDLFIGTRIKI